MPSDDGLTSFLNPYVQIHLGTKIFRHFEFSSIVGSEGFDETKKCVLRIVFWLVSHYDSEGFSVMTSVFRVIFKLLCNFC